MIDFLKPLVPFMAIGIGLVIPCLLILGLVLTVREFVFYCDTTKKKVGLFFLALLYLWGIFSAGIVDMMLYHLGEMILGPRTQ